MSKNSHNSAPLPSTATRSIRPYTAALHIIGLALAYYITGKLGAFLAIPPGYATAIWPPSGIALAGLLAFGYRAWPGIVLGSFLINISTAIAGGSPSEIFNSIAVSLAISGGAALQAIAGAYLVRRFAGFPNALSNEKEVFLFFLFGGIFSALVNSTLAVSTLVVAGRIPAANFLVNWGTWWMGDVLGIFIFTPLALIWVQHRHESWRNRRLAITLPIVTLFVLTTAAVFYEAQNSSERLQREFDQHAATLAVALEKSIFNYSNILRSLGSFYVASTMIDREDFRAFVSYSLEHFKGIKALGWNPHILSSERNSFERSLQNEGYKNFQITERDIDNKRSVRARMRPEYVPITFIEPYSSNESALGYDVYSDALRREAIERARDSGEIAVTAPINLVQNRQDQQGVLAFFPIYQKGLPQQTLEQRHRNISGYVVAVFQSEDLVTAGLKGLNQDRLAYQLIDQQAPSGEQLIFSSDPKQLKPLLLQETGLFGRNFALINRSIIPMGGRSWRFEVVPTQDYFADHRSNNAWLILLAGLLLTSMVSSFVMVFSGRGNRLRRLVEERTAALAQSEDHFKIMFNEAPLGIALIDSFTGQLYSVNPMFAKIAGRTVEEMTHIDWMAITHPDDVEEDLANMALLNAGKINGFQMEKRYLHPDGTSVCIHMTIASINVDDKAHPRHLCMIEDITERKRYERSLRKESEKNLALLRNASDGICILDTDGNIVEVSDSFCAMLGYRRDEMIGMNVTQWDAEFTEQECRRIVNEQFSKPDCSLFETRHRRKDGSIVNVEVSGSPLELEGKPALFNSTRDITARKAAEESLRKLSLAVEQSPNSILITDINGNIEYVNEAFVRITGYRRDEVIGKNPRLMQSGNTPVSTHEEMWSTLLDGRAWKGELINRRKSGDDYVESAWISPVHQPDGSVSHYVGIKEDVTERKKAESLLLESEQRFRHVADAAPVLIWLAGTDKLCFWFNQVWLDFTGRSMEQEIGNGWKECVHPDDFQNCLDIYVSHFDRREPFQMKYRLKRYDGEYRWLNDHGVPRFDANGTFAGYVGSCNDITDMIQAQSQLQASHDLFTELFRQVPGMVYQFKLFSDGHSCLPFASEGIRDIYELTPEQVREDATLVYTRMHPDDYELIMASIQASQSTLQPWQLEFRVNLPEKGIRWVSVLSQPEKLEDGSTLWHGFITDITEQVIARNEANAIKEALESVLSAATEVSIIATDAEGLITMFNRGAERMLGYSAAEMIGKQSPAIIHVQQEAEQHGIELTEELGRPVFGFHIFVEKAVQLGQETREWTYVRKDSSTLTVSLVVTTIRNQHDEITGYLGIAEDITIRKQTEYERDLLLKIIEDAPDFIATADMQSHLKYLNVAGARLVGLPDDIDLSELSIKDFHPEWAAVRIVTEGIATVLRQGFWQGETALLHRDGHEIPVSQLLLLHRDASGNPVLLSTVMRDITVYKQAEQALRQAKEAAEDLAHSKSEFLANMSHEIRTPMNAIIGLSHLALNKETTPDIRDYLEKIYSSSDSLLGILNDILDFSKLEAGYLTIENSLFNLDVLLDTLRNLFADRAREKQLDFKLDIAPNVPRKLIGDALRLQQVLINLLGNAIKFTERGQVALKITAQAYEQTQVQEHVRLLFEVTDSGIGMSSDDSNKLFQPFSQVDGSITRRFGGTGLGLAISHHLLQLMDSQIALESVPGQGSRFSFELVVGVTPTPRLAASRDVGVAPTTHSYDQQLAGTRILVAEDNLINQQVVREFLNLSGISVEIANNGEEALALLKNGVFDAVLMDVHMPKMDGFEATKRIRSQAGFAELPVIALTAGVTQEERERCKTSGMNDFIAKPVNPHQLLSTLLRWVKPVTTRSMDAAEPVTTKPFDAANLPGFDLHNLMGMIGNNQELAVQLLFAFMDIMKHLPDEIESNIAHNDLAAAGKLVHKIKGASGNIGALRLHEASIALENALNSEQVGSALATFRHVFNQAMAVISALHQAEHQSLINQDNSEARRRSAAELDGLLQENDFISEALLNTFKSHLAPNQVDLFTRLRKLINELRYDEARQILRQLAELTDNQEF